MLCRRACIERIYIYKSGLSLRYRDKLNVYHTCYDTFKYHFERSRYEKTNYRKCDNLLRYINFYAVLSLSGYMYTYQCCFSGLLYFNPNRAFAFQNRRINHYLTFRTVLLPIKICYTAFRHYIHSSNVQNKYFSLQTP